MSPENTEETQEDLERAMTITELEDVIRDGQDAHRMIIQNIAMQIGQASDMSHTIGRYMQLLQTKQDIEDSDNATKH